MTPDNLIQKIEECLLEKVFPASVSECICDKAVLEYRDFVIDEFTDILISVCKHRDGCVYEIEIHRIANEMKGRKE